MDMEDELTALHEEAENGNEQVEEQMALLSESLVVEQMVFLARQDLRDIKSQYRPGDRKHVAGGRDRKDGNSNKDRKKRIEDLKKKTRRRVCG